MLNSTSNTYQMKREILNFSAKISRKLSKPGKKFTADMTYGMLASERERLSRYRSLCYYF